MRPHGALVLGFLAMQAVACNRSFHFSNATRGSAGVDALQTTDGPVRPQPEPAVVDAPLLADIPVLFPQDTAVAIAPSPADLAPSPAPEPEPVDAFLPIDSPVAPTPEPVDAFIPVVDAFIPVDRNPPDVATRDASSPDIIDTGNTSNLCGIAASCPCVGTACTCSRLQTCDFSGVGCEKPTGTCSLDCQDGNFCQGQCSNNCGLSCKGGSTCILTMGPNAKAKCEGTTTFCQLNVGASGSVECDDHANCKVTCTGACQLSCDDSTTTSLCQLRCPGESVYVSGSGTCPRGSTPIPEE
jgi:hypothetical protein